jgi:hypothetical protein
MRFFFVLVFTLILNSCGTILRTHDPIAVDSDPRGIVVKNNKDELLGHTPFYLSLENKRKHSLFLPGEEFSFSCPANWSRSLVPNALWLVAGVPGMVISGMSYLIDGINGQLFHCHQGFLIRPKGKQAIALNTSKRILVFPPMANEKLFSRKIVQAFRDTLFPVQAKTDDELFANEDDLDMLEVFGFDHRSNKEGELFFESRRLDRVLAQFKATHILVFELQATKPGETTVIPILYDAFTKEKVVNTEFKNFRVRVIDDQAPLIEKLARVINFFPNTVQMSYYIRPTVRGVWPSFGIDEKDEYQTVRHPKALPVVLSIFSLGSVEHPQFFDDWDFSFRTFPVLGASSWRLNLTSQVPDYIMQMQSYYVIYSAGMTFHTAIGAFGLDAGMGLAFFDWDDSYGGSEQESKMLVRIGFGYTAFINQRLFFRFGVEQYGTKNVGRPDHFQLDSWTDIYTGLGFYTPDIFSSLKSLF